MSSETGPPLDFSFKGLDNIDDMKEETPRRGVKKYKRTPAGRYCCTAVRLNNNNLISMYGLHATIFELLDNPEKLTWLDLSFNRIASIPPEISSFVNLKIFYLHGNTLSDLVTVVRPLKPLQNLISLTLHGNPLEERKGYRNRILHALPNLKSLDFNNITSADRKKLAESRALLLQQQNKK